MPLSATEARGIPLRHSAKLSTPISQASPPAKAPAKRTLAQVAQTSSTSAAATQVKPFRMLATQTKSKQAHRDPLRVSVQNKKVSAFHPGATRVQTKLKPKPSTFFLYAASALLASSLTALTMYALRGAIYSSDETLAMEALSDEYTDQATDAENPDNDATALGGPTEDLVVDAAETQETDAFVPSKYKKDILHLPDLHKMSSGFGIRLDPFSRKMAFHAGVDFKGRIGDVVNASMDGTVSFAGYRGRYGKLIVISHGKGLETRYAHLSRIQVKKGQIVKKGTPIGAIGNTGRSTGPHLHLEVVKNGQKVNPLTTKLQ